MRSPRDYNFFDSFFSNLGQVTYNRTTSHCLAMTRKAIV